MTAGWVLRKGMLRSSLRAAQVSAPGASGAAPSAAGLYEVRVLDWTLNSASDDQTSAIFDAKRLVRTGKHAAVCVVRTDRHGAGRHGSETLFHSGAGTADVWPPSALGDGKASPDETRKWIGRQAIAAKGKPGARRRRSKGSITMAFVYRSALLLGILAAAYGILIVLQGYLGRLAE